MLSFTRGSRDDFDRWAKVTGDEEWTWDALFPYMLKVRTFPAVRFSVASDLDGSQIENLTAPIDHRNTSGEVIASLHGHNGTPQLTPWFLF